MTNPANGDVTCLNKGDLYSLFGPESDGIDTWDGADSLAQQVGGTDNFPSAPLEITAPGEESGTYDAFIELAGIEDTALSQGVPEDKAATLRTDYHSSPDDNVIITAMEGSDTPLGFVGFAFAENAGDQVKILQVDGGDGCVEPTRDTIADESYPLSRTLYIYVNKAKITENPAVKAFVDYYLTRQRHRRRRPADGLRRSAVRPDRGQSVDVDLRVGWYRSDRQLVADHVGTGPAPLRARSRPRPAHEEG